ncbi:MAG: radical SAM protein, partial [Treponema sp.]|nr:radical SAM protein [Treponema sp.]
MNKSNEKSLRIGRPVEYTVTPPFPRNMVLVPNNLCNHTCVFCGYAQIKQKPVSMPLENALRFIDEAYSLGTREIGFCAINEPFMYKYLEELVIHAKKTGYEYTYITTNG